MSDLPKTVDLNRFRYWLITDKNGYENGFKRRALLSNSKISIQSTKNKACFCFINYDHKNDIENFTAKRSNPLQFDNQLFFEVEKTILPDDLIFDEIGLREPQSPISKRINICATVLKDEYIKKVADLKYHIQQGDIYEINYCITFEAKDVIIDPLAIYKKLNKISKASYSALAKFDKLYIISSSPELFLSKRGNHLITKPIKGTAKRGSSLQEDALIKDQLKHNLKEQTENVMIVDVARNDLSRIAKKGTVSVDKLFDIESYEQVHQMVSTVSCELKEQTSLNDIINATFPMASMTGAPKIRAMQLIDQYEVHNRGPYSGALGYIDEKGDFDLSVLIRSIFYDEEKQYLSFTVGSAITAMCNPEEEYEECMLKAKAMIEVLEK